MSPWLDGQSAFAQHTAAALVILFATIWGILVMRGILFRLPGNTFDEASLLSLSTAGWALPVLILSLLTYTLSFLLNTAIAGIAALFLVSLSLFFLFRKKPDSIPALNLIPIALFFPILILRFAFIHDLVLPSYFDSAEHYRLIRSLFESYQTNSAAKALTGGYYHLGFHHILASLAYFFKQEIIELMLVSGPILLTLLPFCFYFIVKLETDSSPAAWFTCLLAGFGFHMPAHLMNWGKYPALLGLYFIPLALGLGYTLHRNNSIQNRKPIFTLLALTVLASTLIHSRTLILYSLMVLAASLTFGWERSSKTYRVSGIVLLSAILSLEIVFIQQDPALRPLIDSYLNKDFPILILLAVLIIFSAHQFPRFTFFLLSWSVLCYLCLFIPIAIPIHGLQTLLDRPFVQMFTFIPLSLLGGLGLSGMTRTLTRLIRPDLLLIQRFIIITLFGFVLLNTALKYNLYPSDCCRFVSRDDLAAFSWLDGSTPPKAKVLIASTNLYVTSLDASQRQTGVDAGIWIQPLLSRAIEPSPPDTPFDQTEIYEQLCQKGVAYIYIGGTSQSFDSAKIESQPPWYKPSFILPSAKVFKLIGCD